MADHSLDLGHLLFESLRSLEARVSEGLAAAGFGELTHAQARLLRRVEAQGARPTDLAAEAAIAKQSVGFLVDQLERDGFVVRVPDPADRRGRLVMVTDRGLHCLAAIRVVEEEVEAEWAARVGAYRMAQLRRILADLRRSGV